ncbi:acetyl xylan esterase AXE1 [Edaphobacter aggregans]|uniref:Acetyl xylan esterase AXE1 n=2 Tax=Edaphobacter aggregans TaxID=570835 RepID=A0A3R9R4U4_9BACT|nr:acetyl xylan esterase AXE1 [Edaphobacter aggregans]
MQMPNLPLFAALLAASFCLAAAQTPAAAPVSPIAKAKPDDPANVGRVQLNHYLDNIADQQLAARTSTVAAIKTRAEAKARQREVRAKILTLIGGLPEKTPLNARTLGTTQADGFRIEKILFDSQPNFPVTALLYLPDAKPGAPQQKLPAIVVAPGHGATGKASDYGFASTFARNGFAVLSYDPIGQGERLQYPDPANPGQSLATRPTGEHGEAGLQPTLLGDAVARYFAWDGIRAVDYLLSRPEIDPNRIGAFGCSGGGAMTALLGALDTRIKVIGTACYITSFDTLLPAIGPQDAEQSTPNFIASGLDFPDWVELVAPRPYAVISTASDMFPYAGARATVVEARRFYSLFDPASDGTPTGAPSPGVPTGPTLNPDTSNTIPPSAALQWITGIGGHGNLRPLQSQIVAFFLTHLAHSDAAPLLPPPPAPSSSPFALPTGISKEAFQVTPTGQVATSYPNAETVHTLNLKRYNALSKPKPLTIPQLQQAVREVTHATVMPGDAPPVNTEAPALASPPEGSVHVRHRFTLATASGIDIQAEFYRPSDGKHPALLILRDSLDPALESSRGDDIRKLRALADAGTAVLVIAPRPSPPGTEETKSPLLGPFYLTELHSELVGKTLVGLRIDDVISAVNFMSHGTTPDPNQISAQASGHLGLVLLHAAVLDPRLKHITIDHTLESYDSLLKAPMPKGAPEDILPGVVRRYDLPDLVRALGPRLTLNDLLPGTADLGATSNPSP